MCGHKKHGLRQKKNEGWKVKGFSTIEILVSLGVFSVIMLSLVSLFRNELTELELVRGSLKKEIVLSRLENTFSDILGPAKKWTGDETKSDLWNAASLKVKTEVVDGGNILRMGEAEYFLEKGSVVMKMGLRSEKVWSSGKAGLEVQKILFKKTGTVLAVTCEFARDHKKETKTFQYLLAE